MPAAESLLDAYLPEYDVSDSRPLVAAPGFSRLLPEVVARVLRQRAELEAATDTRGADAVSP